MAMDRGSKERRAEERRGEERREEDRDYKPIGEEEGYMKCGDLVGGDKHKEGKRRVKCSRLV